MLIYNNRVVPICHDLCNFAKGRLASRIYKFVLKYHLPTVTHAIALHSNLINGTEHKEYRGTGRKMTKKASPRNHKNYINISSVRRVGGAIYVNQRLTRKVGTLRDAQEEDAQLLEAVTNFSKTGDATGEAPRFSRIVRYIKA